MSAPGPFLFLSGGRHPVSVLVDVNPGGKSAQRLGPSGLSLLVSWNLWSSGDCQQHIFFKTLLV